MGGVQNVQNGKIPENIQKSGSTLLYNRQKQRPYKFMERKAKNPSGLKKYVYYNIF